MSYGFSINRGTNNKGCEGKISPVYKNLLEGKELSPSDLLVLGSVIAADSRPTRATFKSAIGLPTLVLKYYAHDGSKLPLHFRTREQILRPCPEYVHFRPAIITESGARY